MNLELLEKHEEIPLKERRIILADVLFKHTELLQTLESLKFLAMGDISQKESYEEIDLLNLVNSLLKSLPTQPDVNIHLNSPEPPPLVLAWREGILLIFRNLIENSKIHGKARNQDLNIYINISVSKNWLTVAIQDDGKGIQGVDIATVTDRFMKGKNSPGSGLGLSLVKQQVEAHGGNLNINSQSDEGTSIVASLPIVTE